eukprot:c8053_g1_i1.p1 GENE.c8053_g1_i1~~c8053_g1_i1.p1  ORF type:complete len:356 (-),score=92.45 c8053_g1_i1:260-1327(-)
MGQCKSKHQPVVEVGVSLKQEVVQNKKIDDELKESKMALRELKLLLLGAGESGKSTFFKQMKIIHLHGFTDLEKLGFKETIHTHCFDNVTDLIHGAKLVGVASAETMEKAGALLAAMDDLGMNAELGDRITELWQMPDIQATYHLRSQFQLCDSTKYFLDNIIRVTRESYVPIPDDILQCRVRTTGVSELTFATNDIKFRVVDVGGQRSERRKWMHCFEDVHAVIFVAAISEYDQVLFEDDKTNRLKESLKLYTEMCNTRFFADTSFILLLNKKDLFEEKIKTVDLNVCFDDYQDGCDYKAAVNFIKDKFRGARKSKEDVYFHVTTATSTGNIRFVFDSVHESILMRNIKGSGMI